MAHRPISSSGNRPLLTGKKNEKTTAPKPPEKRTLTNVAKDSRERRSLPIPNVFDKKLGDVKNASLRNRIKGIPDAVTAASQGKENKKFVSQNKSKTGPKLNRAFQMKSSRSSDHVSGLTRESNDNELNINKMATELENDGAHQCKKSKTDDRANTKNVLHSMNIFDSVKKRITATLPHIKAYSKHLLEEVLVPYTQHHTAHQNHVENGQETCTNGENIELSHFNALMRPTMKIGVGHSFKTIQLQSATWCDKCGDFIWGLSKQCLKCQNCDYTCHQKCHPLVTFDCPRPEDGSSVDGGGQRSRSAETSLSRSDIEIPVKLRKDEDKDTDSGYCTGSIKKKSVRSEVRAQIKPFDITPTTSEAVPTDGSTFQGFIRVNMNLSRPINMAIGSRPPSIYEVMSHGEQKAQQEMVTSFHLPKDTIRSIHITSATTSHEVIEMLLKKFKITDNPRRFALYEQTIENMNEFKMRKLDETERPLEVCVKWSQESLKKKKFMLQENDTGDILWEEFSLPELQNFLRILDKEEQDYEKELRAKYKLHKIRMQEQLKELKKTPVTSVA